MTYLGRLGELKVGDVITIRRSSGVIQPNAVVRWICDRTSLLYRAPEAVTFAVEFTCVEDGQKKTKGCAANDLVS